MLTEAVNLNVSLIQYDAKRIECLSVTVITFADITASEGTEKYYL